MKNLCCMMLCLSLAHSMNAMYELHRAVEAGDIDRATALLRNPKIKINEYDEDGYTPLYKAASQKNIPIARLLINHHANVDQKIRTGSTPIKVAAFRNDEAMVRLLITHGANLHGALQTAAWEGHAPIVRLLLDYGANINEQIKNGDTPLLAAIGSNHFELAHLFIGLNAKVNLYDNYGYTALHAAAIKGNIPLMRSLIAHGARINAKANDKETPLHCAARFLHTDAVRLLREHSAAINCRDKYGWTPLHRAIRCAEFNQTIPLLLHYGANLTLKDKDGYTPLQIAKRDRDPEIINCLTLWPYQSAKRALCCALHPRLGAHSPMSIIGSQPIELIASYLRPEHFVNRLKAKPTLLKRFRNMALTTYRAAQQSTFLHKVYATTRNLLSNRKVQYAAATCTLTGLAAWRLCKYSAARSAQMAKNIRRRA